ERPHWQGLWGHEALFITHQFAPLRREPDIHQPTPEIALDLDQPTIRQCFEGGPCARIDQASINESLFEAGMACNGVRILNASPLSRRSVVVVARVVGL